MDWFKALWLEDSIAHSVLILGVVITLGVAVGRLQWKGIGLGVAGVLFTGLVFSEFGLAPKDAILDFLRDFGLILFVFSIGMQVGPGFIASFKREGWKLNLATLAIVLLGAGMTVALKYAAGLPPALATGIFSGASFNIPSLAAAQQLLAELPGGGEMARQAGTGCAVAYPVGISGVILVLIILKSVLRVRVAWEREALERSQPGAKKMRNANFVVKNPEVVGKPLEELDAFRRVTISRVMHGGKVSLAGPDTVLGEGDVVHAVGHQAALDDLEGAVGIPTNLDLRKVPSRLDSKWVLVTERASLGKPLGRLSSLADGKLRITRVVRAGLEMGARDDLELQYGDLVMAVGEENDLKKLSSELGNSKTHYEHPQLIPIFLGIVLGVVAGCVPIRFPGFPIPVKLGLAGGPLLVAIALSRVGRVGPVIWHVSPGAKAMLREIGIALFLACVGLKAGANFFHALGTASGWIWMGYGALVTLVPLLVVGLVLRRALRLNFLALCGALAGSTTAPPALAFSTSLCGSEAPAVSYASVYPLAMILRITVAQLLVLILH